MWHSILQSPSRHVKFATSNKVEVASSDLSVITKIDSRIAIFGNDTNQEGDKHATLGTVGSHSKIRHLRQFENLDLDGISCAFQKIVNLQSKKSYHHTSLHPYPQTHKTELHLELTPASHDEHQQQDLYTHVFP